MHIEHDDADQLYRSLIKAIMFDGNEIAPRGLLTKEINVLTLRLTEPKYNVVCDPYRKVNKGFMAAELMWMLDGRCDLDMVKMYNSRMVEYSDDGVTLWGAYGPKLKPQLKYVYDTLRRDPTSRQAVITIWQESPPPTKDVPCTVMMHFLIRYGQLHLIVYMRSNDAWFGFPYDLHNFTSIQFVMAALLDVKVGSYNHVAGSLHLYQSNFDVIENYLAKGAYNRPKLISTPFPDFKVTGEDPWIVFEQRLEWARNMHKTFKALQTSQLEPYKWQSVTLEILQYECSFFSQKLLWMCRYIRRKCETKPS